MSATQYLKLEVTDNEIAINMGNNTCQITDSKIDQSVELKDSGTNPNLWSRGQLIEQFNLVSTYPWFKNNTLKNTVNKATLKNIICYVHLISGDSEEGVTIPITDLKHFDDDVNHQFRLRLNTDLSAINFLSSDSYINEFAQNTEEYEKTLNNVLKVEGESTLVGLPNFTLNDKGEIGLNVNTTLEKYQVYSEDGTTSYDFEPTNDIQGFYYEHNNSQIPVNNNSIFIVEFEYPRDILINKDQVLEYINNPNSYYFPELIATMPPQSKDFTDTDYQKDPSDYLRPPAQYKLVTDRLSSISDDVSPTLWTYDTGRLKLASSVEGEVTTHSRLYVTNSNEAHVPVEIEFLEYDNSNDKPFKYGTLELTEEEMKTLFGAYKALVPGGGSNESVGGAGGLLGGDQSSEGDGQKEYVKLIFNVKTYDVKISTGNVGSTWKSVKGMRPHHDFKNFTIHEDKILYVGQAPDDDKLNPWKRDHHTWLYRNLVIEEDNYSQPTATVEEGTELLKITFLDGLSNLQFVDILDNEGIKVPKYPWSGYGRLLVKPIPYNVPMTINTYNSGDGMISQHAALRVPKKNPQTLEYGNLNDVTYLFSPLGGVINDIDIYSWYKINSTDTLPYDYGSSYVIKMFDTYFKFHTPLSQGSYLGLINEQHAGAVDTFITTSISQEIRSDSVADIFRSSIGMYLQKGRTESSADESVTTTEYSYSIGNYFMWTDKNDGAQLLPKHNAYLVDDLLRTDLAPSRASLVNSFESNGNNSSSDEYAKLDYTKKKINWVKNGTYTYYHNINDDRDEKNHALRGLINWINDNDFTVTNSLTPETYSHIAFGTILNRGNQFNYVPITSDTDLQSVYREGSTELLYKVIPQSNVWNITESKTLTYKLVNNGIIVLGNNVKLTIRSTKHNLINNGIIMSDGASIEFKHEDDLSNNNVPFFESNSNLEVQWWEDEVENPPWKITNDSDNKLGMYPILTAPGQSSAATTAVINKLSDKLHSVYIPYSIQNLQAKYKSTYNNITSDLNSTINLLAVSSNASDATIPKWNDNSKSLMFSIVSPVLSYNSPVVNELFYNLFVPDTLVYQWFNASRTEIEDGLLGTSDGSTPKRTLSVSKQSSNSFEEGIPVSEPMVITTQRALNSALGGLLIKIDVSAKSTSAVIY